MGIDWPPAKKKKTEASTIHSCLVTNKSPATCPSFQITPSSSKSVPAPSFIRLLFFPPHLISSLNQPPSSHSLTSCASLLIPPRCLHHFWLLCPSTRALSLSLSLFRLITCLVNALIDSAIGDARTPARLQCRRRSAAHLTCVRKQ